MSFFLFGSVVISLGMTNGKVISKQCGCRVGINTIPRSLLLCLKFSKIHNKWIGWNVKDPVGTIGTCAPIFIFLPRRSSSSFSSFSSFSSLSGIYKYEIFNELITLKFSIVPRLSSSKASVPRPSSFVPRHSLTSLV